MADTFLIYGSYGYSGNLIAEEAVRLGLHPILAGRDAEKLSEQAARLELDYRAFDLNKREALDEALEKVALVLNCAGPYSHTYKPVAEACLRTGTHYMDITGEIAVFEALADLDKRAREAGVMLLPGMGMDVVPSDCLALHLKKRTPNATQLTLAILTLGAGRSRGTTLTGVEGIDKGSAVRRDSKIVRIPLGEKTRRFDFGRGPLEMVSMPWGDVSTAYYSTGIANIEVYMYVPTSMRSMMKLSRYTDWLMGSRPVQWLLKQLVEMGSPGPPEEARREGHSYLLGEVRTEGGQFAAARMETPEAYTLTARTAAEGARRVLMGEFKPGFQTPAMAFGENFILDFEGVEWEDLEKRI